VSMQSTVVILDSHQLFSFGIQALLGAFGADVPSFVVNSLEEALEKLKLEQSIKLAIVDLSAPGMAGPTTIKMLRNRFPQLKIIAVSASQNRDVIFECLVQGAYGCILKTQPGTEILNAIRVVLSGGIYVPASVADAAENSVDLSLASESILIAVKGDERVTASGTEATASVHLSKQQLVVLRLLIRGLSNKAIARELQLAEGTIKVHLNGVFKALKVNSRVQAVIRSAEYLYDDRAANLDFTALGNKQGPDSGVQFAIN
jgi:DNA-binding NarL/FixJ family response regulator